jgi:hypothetical protein
VTANGPTTRFIDANLQLTVTPHITADGSILMKINASQNEISDRRDTFGTPGIFIREAETEMIVQDGDTAVLGGIYRRSQRDTTNVVPFLGDVPILGLLFRSTATSDERDELLEQMPCEREVRAGYPCVERREHRQRIAAREQQEEVANDAHTKRCPLRVNPKAECVCDSESESWRRRVVGDYIFEKYHFIVNPETAPTYTPGPSHTPGPACRARSSPPPHRARVRAGGVRG